MAQPEVAAGPEHFDSSPSDDPSSNDAIGALGRTSVQLEQARFELTLARSVQARLLKEIERLEHRLTDSEAERLELLEKVDDRDRLLGQIFGSRSWRWAQRLRRVLGRF